MAEAAAKYGLQALLEALPGLASETDPDDKHFKAGDALRLIGRVAFTSGGTDDRPLLACDYGIKIIVPQGFPGSLPRIYSTDGQVQENYHTYPSGELCLGAPLELHAILQEEPSLSNFVTGALVPFLYRHRYTVEHDEGGPRGWDDLEHGTPGLLQFYGVRLGVSDYGACLALLRQAGRKQQKKGRGAQCPCGSGSTLFECHFEMMREIRRQVGREAIWKAYLHLRRSGPPSPTEADPG